MTLNPAAETAAVADDNGGTLLRMLPSRRSYFFKADSFPEVVANEQLDRRSRKNSCYLPIKELNKWIKD